MNYSKPLRQPQVDPAYRIYLTHRNSINKKMKTSNKNNDGISDSIFFGCYVIFGQNEPRDRLRRLSFEKSCRMHQSTCQTDFWSSSLDFFCCRSLDRSIARSPIARSLDRSIARSFDRSIARSLARSLDRSIARSLDRSLARSLDRSLDHSLDRSIARSIARSLARSIARSLDRWLNRSLRRSPLDRSL